MALTPEQIPFDKDNNGKLEGAEVTAFTIALIDGATSTTENKNAKSGLGTATEKTKLTTQSARTLIETVAQSVDYMGKFSTADIAQFVKEFDAEQATQIAKVVTSSAQKITPGGTTPGAVDKALETTAKVEYPSYFNPTKFAQDWIWKKINFKDEKSLGAKSLTALGQVRGLVESFQLMGVSDNDIRAVAKQIAMGKKTIEDYTVELQKIAKKEYPQFTDRFDADPTLTTYDIASPVIKLLAKTWEMDEKDISFDDPIVSSYMSYGGPDGKGLPPSRADVVSKAKKHRKYQETIQANEDARDAAVGLARAFGFGV